MNETLEINRLGRRGDGIAETAEGPVYVPFTLAGERVAASGAGARRRLDAVIDPSRERCAPICRHFGACGGCQLQHFEQNAYLDWKRNLVVEALSRANIEAEIGAVTSFPVASRRRVIFTAIRTAAATLLGYSQRDSNRIINIAQCPILLPEIAGRLAQLRELAAVLAPKKGTIKLAVLACNNGLDVAVSMDGRPSQAKLDAAIAMAGRFGLARLSVNGEVLAEFERPLIACGSAMVSPPPEAFVQAVQAAEEAMADLAKGHLRDCKRVADLFAGFGAFALRLAENSEVHAAETNGPALEALDRAWRETGGKLKRVTTEKRDLYRRPLMAAELKKTDGVVFDPPRAGAEAQARELAASTVARIAAVSCNPVTLARDLRILVDGGYRLVSVTPVDQFVFTPHVEAVALLER